MTNLRLLRASVKRPAAAVQGTLFGKAKKHPKIGSNGLWTAADIEWFGLSAAMERRLAAILAADVQGYSHLTQLNVESSTATLRSYSARPAS